MAPVDRRLLLLPAAGLLALTACGEDEPFPDATAQEVVERSVDAAGEAESVYVVGDVDLEGMEAGFDLRLGDRAATGTVSFGDAELDLRLDGDVVVFAGSTGFWEVSGLPPEVAAELDGVFVDASGQPDVVSGFAEFDVDELLSSFTDGLADGVDYTRGDVVDVDGQEALEVLDGEGGRLLVSTGEPPYPLRLQDEEFGAVDLREWDQEVDVEIPDDATPITELQQRFGG